MNDMRSEILQRFVTCASRELQLCAQALGTRLARESNPDEITRAISIEFAVAVDRMVRQAHLSFVLQTAEASSTRAEQPDTIGSDCAADGSAT
jgi:hypothetical protein